MNERQYHLVKVIQKIEVFQGFDAAEVERLLRICRFQSFAAGDRVYRRGGISDSMLILLRGMMLVLGEDGKELARVRPGKPMGEMGLFTGQRRSADVVAGEKATALVLARSDLLPMLTAHRGMMVKVLQNVIHVLSARLEDTNSLVAAQSRTLHDLERRLREYEPRAAAAGDGAQASELDQD